MELTIRHALPTEAETLTQISFASKRFWNYPESYFLTWKEELTITPEYIVKNQVLVAERSGNLLGYYSLVDIDQDYQSGNLFIPKGHWLEHLFVLPEAMGQGIGRRLTQHAIDHCIGMGWDSLFILADPNARGFYDKMGAIYLRETPSSIPDRTVSFYALAVKPGCFPWESGGFVIDHLPRHPDFVPAVARWIYDAFVDHELWTFEAIQSRFANRRIDALPMTWIALERGQCVGTVSLFPNDLKTRPTLCPWLAALFVPPENRGRTVAARLIEAAITESRRLGYDLLYLRTEHTDEYYRQRGWRFLEETNDINGQKTKVFYNSLS